jgi:hypothetical protein
VSLHKDVQHVMTPQYFIDLRLAIHGGDPAPHPVGVLVAGAAVLEHLDATDSDAGRLRGQVVDVMQKQLGEFH